MDGGVFAFGNASYYGSMGSQSLNGAIKGIVATPDGKGYWLVNASGRIYQFGYAGSFGGDAVRTLNKPIVGMGATPDGKGYWLVALEGA